jgi:PhnB protein
MNDKVKAIPPGMHTVTPYLPFKETLKAIEFYQKAFGATDVTILRMPDGKVMHAQIDALLRERRHCF